MNRDVLAYVIRCDEIAEVAMPGYWSVSVCSNAVRVMTGDRAEANRVAAEAGWLQMPEGRHRCPDHRGLAERTPEMHPTRRDLDRLTPPPTDPWHGIPAAPSTTTKEIR